MIAKDPEAQKFLAGATQEQKVALNSFFDSFDDVFKDAPDAWRNVELNRAHSDIADALGSGTQDMLETLNQLVDEAHQPKIA